MPDEVTPGELGRRLEAHEHRTASEHRALDERITRVAAESVPLGVWQQTELAHVAEAKRLEREHAADLVLVRDELKELRGRGWLTTGRIVVIATAVIALAALLVQAWGTLKGAK